MTARVHAHCRGLIQRRFFKTSSIKYCKHAKKLTNRYHLHFHKAQTLCTDEPYWIYSIFIYCHSKIHTTVKCIPFIQSTTWLVDHLLTGSMTRAIVEVFADGAKQRCERGASAHSRSTHADFCLFFIRCMFTLQFLPWFLKNEALVVFQVQSIALHSFALVFVRELSE